MYALKDNNEHIVDCYKSNFNKTREILENEKNELSLKLLYGCAKSSYESIDPLQMAIKVVDEFRKSRKESTVILDKEFLVIKKLSQYSKFIKLILSQSDTAEVYFSYDKNDVDITAYINHISSEKVYEYIEIYSSFMTEIDEYFTFLVLDIENIESTSENTLKFNRSSSHAFL